MSEETKPQMLLSFINQVAVMVNDRVLFTHCVICEEIFGAKTEIGAKDEPKEAKQGKAFWKNWRNSPPMRAPLDFPLYVKVISFGDGRKFDVVRPLIVKYNNVSAIMEL